ncbi:hypothetical protein P9D43_20030 [Neobacillus niacini]|uniref:hypothetical protein n=1 Tax=Neobacillus niacini TaxID=86668 RepID=UPI00052FD41F|nr:hypothetical protein [Neobacillus niacini]KGM44657.1 hypothetical protein NP83_10470 [Neobacillus niacini]MEC1524294.1 hypothetical protein [Neobacillus niacini]
MLKLVFIILLVLLAITILFFILTKNKQGMIRTYSISTFLGTSTDDDFLGPKQSITEKINNFFNDNQDEDDNIDDGGDDTGE